jgi:hypothetical protein
MKFALIAAVALAGVAPAAFAQTAPAPAPAAAPAATAKFNLDTPIEALVADPRAKAVLDADLPGTTTHPHYDMFKGMSLRAVQPMSGGKLTDEQLKKVEAGLAAIK